MLFVGRYSPALRVAPLLLALVTSACGSTTTAAPDASYEDATIAQERRVLEFQTEPLALSPVTEATLSVRLLDGETSTPVEGADVTFALEGAPLGSTLRHLDAITDAAGVASVVLVAGPNATAFQVRATATYADPALLDVSVGDAFGALSVRVASEQSRLTGPYVVRLHASTSCSATSDATASTSRTLGSDASATTFARLASAVPWTVEVIARAPSGSGPAIVRGCTDGVVIDAEQTVETTVAVRDIAYGVEGSYTATWTFDATAAIGSLDSALTSIALFGSGTDSDADMLLTAIATELAARGDDAALSTLTSLRASGLDERLAARLVSVGATLGGPLRACADTTATDLASVRLSGPLNLASWNARWTTSDVVAGTLSLALALDAAESVYALGPSDAISFEALHVGLGAGSLWRAAFLAELDRTLGAASLGDYVAGSAACSATSDLLVEEGIAACDGTCVVDACTRLGNAASSLVDVLVVAADTNVATLVLAPAGTLADLDGDLAADSISATETHATWAGASEPIVVDGSFLASRSPS